MGSLLGIKTVLNEFIAYLQLQAMPADALSEHSKLIALYAVCGFANLSSVGIQISGIGAMCPERRPDLATPRIPRACSRPRWPPACAAPWSASCP